MIWPLTLNIRSTKDLIINNNTGNCQILGVNFLFLPTLVNGERTGIDRLLVAGQTKSTSHFNILALKCTLSPHNPFEFLK